MVNILVLEDDIRLNQIVSSTLKNNGYRVISCNSAMEGYDALEANIVDLIFYLSCSPIRKRHSPDSS